MYFKLSATADYKNQMFKSQGSRAQLKQSLITIMVTSNEYKMTYKPLSPFNKNFCRRVTEIKSVWLVISEAGNAVCRVVYSSSAEIFFSLYWISSKALCSWLTCGIAMQRCKVQVQKVKVLLSVLFNHLDLLIQTGNRNN